MIRGRKCRENTKLITGTEDVVSPKRKDMKLSINHNAKTEMASTKKPEYVYRKSSRNKRDLKPMEITSTITDFFHLKSIDTKYDTTVIKNQFMCRKQTEKIEQPINNIDETFKEDNSIDLVQQRVSHSNEQLNLSETIMISSCLDDTKQSPAKPVTPHRIVCLSPQKNKSESPEPVVLIDNKRPVRTKKRLDIVSRENSSDEISILTSNGDPKKQVLNSSANPSARQNTKNNKKSNKEDEANNKKLTDFFPIRRSVRKTNKEVQQELIRSYEKAIIEQSEDGLEVKTFDNKGRGVVAMRPFRKNEFVLEYVGELISISEANKREVKYAKDENTGCYMYYFKYSEQQYCIDATEESGKLGRLVNHSRNGNLVTKTVAVKGQPHLILVAKNDIKPGVELTYDYGDRSKESLTHHPWLAY